MPTEARSIGSLGTGVIVDCGENGGGENRIPGLCKGCMYFKPLSHLSVSHPI